MADLLDVSSLPLAERVKLLSGDGPWHSYAAGGLPAAELSDGPHGLRTETGVDMVWIPSTGFPTGSALASSWDAELARRVGRAIGEEARAMGVQCVLGPGVNLKRSPLCGRNFEYFSEDPALAAVLGAAWVEGIQSTGVAACLKHFAANNQETRRTEMSVEADETTLRELYLEAFRRIVQTARPWSVMCSYNRIHGVHASQHRWLLTDVLRDEWGFDGLVVSDWDAVHDPVAAVRAGLDLEMPGTDGRSAAALLAAVRSGDLTEAEVDRAAERVVRFVSRVLPDGWPPASPVRDPGVTPGAPLTAGQATALGVGEHHRLAREAAAAAAVLLRNDGVLPLEAQGSGSIAVIGGYAVTPRIQGGGSAGVCPTMVDAPLDAIREAAGTDRVWYAPGYPVGATNYYEEAEAHGQDAGLLRAEAVAVAAQAEVVIVFAGLPLLDEREAFDRDHLDLPAAQTDLLVELAQLDRPLVVVLQAGSAAVLDPGWHDRASAILLTHLGGQAVGSATADLLFGRVNPSGKLAETWPLRLADTPGIDTFPDLDTARYPEGPLIGYRWYDSRALAVGYPFGHGLSYTSFGYGSLSATGGAEGLDLWIEVENTGVLPGAEVVQFYLTPPREANRPRFLAGFVKLPLGPGEAGTARLRVRYRDLASWSPEDGWQQPAGQWRVEAGASSRDLRQQTVVGLAARDFPS
ncbi:MAG: glycoside hydrolase family 3 C-terminal domain-containing protein [Propionicimonas sp.]|uniref:beta-glucosidase n=1 Tax=Propionicimonas sp. TaxID=1955623 RepID=UPI002B21D330|nr:glycoside hydrolase family 3 C-terminal domain-containing protein [Propionicimonas sp.]MEA4943040.1 glycoside hydrolase family 3 C-terminal domain-containing protein [Propionicimonas sp.]